jgi:hypothetical protein
MDASKSIRVTDEQTQKAEIVTAVVFCKTLSRFFSDDEIDALEAGDCVTVETNSAVVTCEVVR